MALLTNATYAAEVGQEFKFDASPSYILNDEKIAKYEWDFDGNNTFETTTTTPSITHAYSSEFDGIIQVKVSTAQGITSNASAKIHVGHVKRRQSARPHHKILFKPSLPLITIKVQLS